jgi:hypothetical protein
MYAYGCSGDKVLMVSTLMEAPEVRLDYACAGAGAHVPRHTAAYFPLHFMHGERHTVCGSAASAAAAADTLCRARR